MPEISNCRFEKLQTFSVLFGATSVRAVGAKETHAFRIHTLCLIPVHSPSNLLLAGSLASTGSHHR